MLIVPRRRIKPASGGGGGGSLAVAWLGYAEPDTSSMSTTFTASINVGTLAAGTLLVVYLGVQNQAVASAVVYDPSGANITLSKDTTADTSNYNGIWSGVVPAGSGSKTIRVTFGSSINYQSVVADAWKITGQTANVAQTAITGENNVNIGVTGGRVLLTGAFLPGSLPTGIDYSSSTPAGPTSYRAPDTTIASAEWGPGATSTATFTIYPKYGGSAHIAAATYK